jgi:hypothetical protein
LTGSIKATVRLGSIIAAADRTALCCADDQIWIVAGIEGIEAGEELTYEYGSEYYPRKRRNKK